MTSSSARSNKSLALNRLCIKYDVPKDKKQLIDRVLERIRHGDVRSDKHLRATTTPTDRLHALIGKQMLHAVSSRLEERRDLRTNAFVLYVLHDTNASINYMSCHDILKNISITRRIETQGDTRQRALEIQEWCNSCTKCYEYDDSHDTYHTFITNDVDTVRKYFNFGRLYHYEQVLEKHKKNQQDDGNLIRDYLNHVETRNDHHAFKPSNVPMYICDSLLKQCHMDKYEFVRNVTR